MAFITTSNIKNASREVRSMYSRLAGKSGAIPAYARIFSHRPQLMTDWANLQRGIKKSMDHRQFELATLASAVALRSTNCSLAHAMKLRQYYPLEDIEAIVAGRGVDLGIISPKDQALYDFAYKVGLDASTITKDEVDDLIDQGFNHEDVFDIVSAAAARAFFTKMLDSLGCETDQTYEQLPPTLLKALTVGREIKQAPRMLMPLNDDEWLRYSG